MYRFKTTKNKMEENKLLSDVIADVKNLKSLAEEMARNSIAESLTPTIQSLLSQKLAEDLSENEDEGADDVATSDGEAPAAEPAKSADLEEGEGDMQEALIAKLKEAGIDEATIAAVTNALNEKKDEAEAHAEPDADNAGGPSDNDADNEEATNEDLDLDAILAEMEDATTVKDDEEGKEVVKEGEYSDEDADKDEKVDESLDIDALLAEISAEDTEDETPAEEDDKKPTDEAQLQELRSQLQESNLLMAKLLYQNKLLSKGNVSEAHQANIIKAIDKAKTVNEAKLIFETLQNVSVTPVAKQKTVAESLGFNKAAAKKPLDQEKKVMLSEQAVIFQRRAGIRK